MSGKGPITCNAQGHGQFPPESKPVSLILIKEHTIVNYKTFFILTPFSSLILIYIYIYIF